MKGEKMRGQMMKMMMTLALTVFCSAALTAGEIPKSKEVYLNTMAFSYKADPESPKWRPDKNNSSLIDGKWIRPSRGSAIYDADVNIKIIPETFEAIKKVIVYAFHQMEFTHKSISLYAKSGEKWEEVATVQNGRKPSSDRNAPPLKYEFDVNKKATELKVGVRTENGNRVLLGEIILLRKHVIPEQREKYLVLDSRNIDVTENATLTVGKAKKHKGNPLFGEDKPWERDLAHMYNNIIFDEEEQIYKLWYYTKISLLRGNQEDLSKHITPGPLEPNDIKHWNEALLYATSKDGIKWDKPELDVYKYDGKPCNMIVWGVPGTGVFKDLHDPDPSRRYKLFTGGVPHGTLLVAFSPDGIHWSKRQEVLRGANLRELKADTHNNAFWDPELKKYIGITRGFPGLRTVLRTESEDFIHWTKPVEVMRGPYMAQTYAMPVFKYAGVYLGLPCIYYVRSLGNRMGTELAWSPDSKVWLRVDEGSRVIPLGEKRARDYDWGCIFAAKDPVILKDEIRIYYSGQAFPHGMNPGHFCLATLRPDGWAGFEPKDKNKPAVVLTNPIICSAEKLRISADAKGGSMETTVLDENGKTLALGKLITDDVTDAPVTFGSDGLKAILGRRVQLQFKLNRAKIYAFGFKE